MTAPTDPTQQAIHHAWILRLRKAKQQVGRVPHGMRQRAAEACGVTPRTISRWVEEEYGPKPPAFHLDDRLQELVCLFGGNVRLAYQHAKQLGLDGGVSYRTWLTADKVLPRHRRRSSRRASRPLRPTPHPPVARPAARASQPRPPA